MSMKVCILAALVTGTQGLVTADTQPGMDSSAALGLLANIAGDKLGLPQGLLQTGIARVAQHHADLQEDHQKKVAAGEADADSTTPGLMDALNLAGASTVAEMSQNLQRGNGIQDLVGKKMPMMNLAGTGVAPSEAPF